MDFLGKVASQVTKATGDKKEEQQPAQQSGAGGLLGKLGDVANTIGGGGKESEKKEDFLDKGIDLVQEKVFKQGPQDNESALEQAKDEKIAGFLRDQYKKTTGNEFPGSLKK